MKTKISSLLFLIAGLFPIYYVISWIFVFNNYPEFAQEEKRTKFFNDFYFGIQVNSIFAIVLGIISISYFLFRLVKKESKNKFENFLYILLIVLIFIFTLLNIWFVL